MFCCAVANIKSRRWNLFDFEIDSFSSMNPQGTFTLTYIKYYTINNCVHEYCILDSRFSLSINCTIIGFAVFKFR